MANQTMASITTDSPLTEGVSHLRTDSQSAGDAVLRVPLDWTGYRKVMSPVRVNRVAGVHVKSGALNVSVVGRSTADTDTIELISTKRIECNPALSDAVRLADLIDRFRQHLSPLDVSAIAILQTRAFKNLKYIDAFNRVFAVCAVLQGSSALQVDAITYKTDAVGASLSLKPDRLNEFAFTEVGEIKAPTYWTTGMAQASSVAVHALMDSNG